MAARSIEVRPASALELYRRGAGLGRSALAQRVGVHRETIARLERGEHEPRRSTAALIAAALGVKVESLWPEGGGK